ncbi:MAG: hypothetical protein K2X87_16850 [Gemmataceae bacterium]|nr:hypothetical protein [Gemmataceae bacterium]
MRRAGVLGVVLAAAVGCGPGKELPDEVRVSTGKGGEAAPPVPKASEPAAAELVARVLKANTDGHPERLEKGKTNTSLARGMSRGSDGKLASANRTIWAAWPDRFRVDFEFPTAEVKDRLMGLRRPTFWMYTSGPGGLAEFRVPNPEEYADVLAADAVGQHWLPTLVPLTDPKVVVFDAKRQDLGRLPAETVKVAVPGCPVYTLWFDPATLRLGVVSYTHAEAAGGGTFHKRLTMDKHKDFGGMMLPTRLEFSRNGQTVEEWGVEKWDLGAAVDDAAFNPPATTPAKK